MSEEKCKHCKLIDGLDNLGKCTNKDHSLTFCSLNTMEFCNMAETPYQEPFKQLQTAKEDIKTIIFGLYLLDDKPHQGWDRFKSIVEKYEPDNKDAIKNCDDMYNLGFDSTPDGLKKLFQQNKQMREALEKYANIKDTFKHLPEDTLNLLIAGIGIQNIAQQALNQAKEGE